MVYMARTQSSTAAKPLLSFIFQNAYGFLADVDALSFAVFDVSTPAKELTPVEVVAKTALSLEDAPVGNKLSQGRYFAPLTIGADWSLGLHEVVWYYNAGSGEVETRQSLLVTSEEHGPPLWYATVQDMYDAGLDPAEFTVVQIRAALKRAAQFIDRVTGRHFAPVYKTIKVDGRGGPKLRLREPIIAVESVLPASEWFDYTDLNKYSLGYRVYNRHIRLGMLQPDDRNNPKIEISYSSRPYGPWGRWPDGSQDVEVVGVFGYTDPDGSPFGETPELIKYVAKLLATLYVTPEASPEAWGNKNKWKITEEKTDLQSVKYGGTGTGAGSTYKGPGTGAYFTGDDEIDSILLQYRVGPGMTGA